MQHGKNKQGFTARRTKPAATSALDFYDLLIEALYGFAKLVHYLCSRCF